MNKSDLNAKKILENSYLAGLGILAELSLPAVLLVICFAIMLILWGTIK